MLGLFRRRKIFCFHDGSRRRRIDPWQAVRRLYSHPTFDWQHHGKILFDGPLPGDSPMASEAYHEALEITLSAVRDVFGINQVENGGLTDLETLEVLAAFERYVVAIKKKHDPLPTSHSRTEPESSDGSTPKHGSASGSTSIVLNSDERPLLHPG